MKDLQGTTDPDTFSITSNRLLLIHVDHLELLNSSSSSQKKHLRTSPHLHSPPFPSQSSPHRFSGRGLAGAGPGGH